MRRRLALLVLLAPSVDTPRPRVRLSPLLFRLTGSSGESVIVVAAFKQLPVQRRSPVRAVQGPPESGPRLWNDRIATEEIERRSHPESSQDCEQETACNG